jgi:predicted methyltransferase
MEAAMAMGSKRLHTRWASLALAGLVLAGVSPAAQGHGSEAQREQGQRAADIFAALGAKPGAAIADIGAGQGFYTIRLAKAVGVTGRVLAVDIDAARVRALRERAAADGLSQVEVIEGRTDDPRLPPASLDGALIVNAYHEMTEYASMLAHIRAALKPGGRLVIVEPITEARRAERRDAQTRRHEIAPAIVQEDARAAGFEVVSLEDPFSTWHGSYWMLVLSPAAGGADAPQPRR